MASIKKGYLAKPPSISAFWKHLRDTKRAFWKRQRAADKREATEQERRDHQ